jgi:pimeloyl-ACP methyl ester carboxylesterase
MDIVAEPHAVLAAAGVPEPYVLVGHSFGGLVVLLYGQTYPEQLAGIVFVDAFSPTVPELFGDKWPIYRDQLLNPPADQAPLDAFAQSRLGNRRPGRQRSPGACGADSARHAVGRVDQDGVVRRLTSVPGLQADETNALYDRRRTVSSHSRQVRRGSSRPEAITTSSSPNQIW